MKQNKSGGRRGRQRASETAARIAGARLRAKRDLLATTALQATAVLLLAFPAARAAAQPAATARPQGGAVVAGQASISQTTAQTTVQQSSQRAAVNWTSYDIGSQHTVQYQQPNASAVVLNRVTGPDPSQIAGRIQANGQVVITNQSGVVFYKGSQVDVQSLVVSSAGVTNQNFMAGKMLFDQPGRHNAKITNDGTITVAATGLAALVAPQVANNGLIVAKMGHVVLAGAEAHTVDLYGDGLMSVDVTRQVTRAPNGGAALVTNTGTVQADGGTVVLTAKAADGIMTNLVSNKGRLQANTANGQPGTVVMSAVGGSVSIEGAVVADGRTQGAPAGTIVLAATDTVALAPTARVSASGQGGGGTIAIGTTPARAQAQGGGIPAASARNVVVAPGARIAADGRGTASGGTVALLATGQTTMAGRITARGGKAGGDGGRVEVSGSKLALTGRVDTSAPKGRTGTLTLDPTTLTIGDTEGTGDNSVNATPPGTVNALNGTGETSINADTFNSLAATNDIIMSADTTIRLQGGTQLGNTGHSVTLISGVNLGAGGSITVDSTLPGLIGSSIFLTNVGSGGIITVNAPTTASTGSLTLGTIGNTATVNVGAALQAATLLAVRADAINVSSAGVLRSPASIVAFEAGAGGVTIAGGAVRAGLLAQFNVPNGNVTLSGAGSIQAPTVTFNGTFAISGGQLTATTLTMPKLAMTGGTIWADGDIATNTPTGGLSGGTLASHGSITVDNLVTMPSGTLAADGNITLNGQAGLPMSLGGTITALGDLTAAQNAIGSAAGTGGGLTTAATLTAGGTMLLYTADGGLAQTGGSASAATIRGIALAGGNTLAATTKPTIAGTVGTPNLAAASPGAPGTLTVTANGRPSLLRLDGTSITPGAALAADLVELHTTSGDISVANGLATATLRGTAGYGTPYAGLPGAYAFDNTSGLPTYNGTAVGTGNVAISGTNAVAALSRFDAAGTFTLANAASLDVSGPLTAVGAVSLTNTGGTSIGVNAPVSGAGVALSAAALTVANTVTGGGQTIALTTDALTATAATFSNAGGTTAYAPLTPGALAVDAATIAKLAPTGATAPARLNLGSTAAAPDASNTATATSLSLTGTPTIGATTLGLYARTSVSVPSALTVNTLTGAAGTAASLANAGNAIQTLAGFATGTGLSVADGVALSVTGAASATTGNVALSGTSLALTSTGSAIAGGTVGLTGPSGITLAGTARGGTAVNLTGAATQSAGLVAAPTVTFSAALAQNGGAVDATNLTLATLTQTAGTIWTGSAFTTSAATVAGTVASSGNVTLNNVTTLSGTVLSDAAIAINTPAATPLSLSGTLVAAGNIDIVQGTLGSAGGAGGGIAQSGGAVSAGGNLLVYAADGALQGSTGTLRGTQVRLVSLVGDNQFAAAARATLTGTVGAPDLSQPSIGSPNTPSVANGARPTLLRLDGNTVTTSGALAGDVVELHSVGSTQANGTVSAGTIRGTAGYRAGAASAAFDQFPNLRNYGTITAGTLNGGSASIGNGGSAIAAIGPYFVGGSGTFTTGGALDVAGTLTVGANTLTLNAGSLTQSGGTLNAGTLSGTVTTGNATLGGTAASPIATFATLGDFTVSNGALALVNSGAITINGNLSALNGVRLDTPLATPDTIIQNGGIISGGGFAGRGTAISLTQPGNSFATLGDTTATAGNITLAHTGALTVSGPVVAASATVGITNTGALTVAATASPATIRGRSVTLNATSIGITGGTIGAGQVSGVGGNIALTTTGGTTISGAGAVVGGQSIVTVTGGLAQSAGTLDAPTVSIAGGFTQTGGRVVGNAVTVGGTLDQTAGGSIWTGTNFSATATRVASIASGGTVTLSGLTALTGTVTADGNVSITAPGATALALSGNVVTKGSLAITQGTQGVQGSGGGITQTAGQLAASGTATIYAADGAATQTGGTLAAATVRVVALAGDNSFTPSARATLTGTVGAPTTFLCPGCTGSADPGAPGTVSVVLAGQPTTVRLDGVTLTLANPVAGTAVELHSTGNTAAASTITATTLTGTAGYARLGFDGSNLPTYDTATLSTLGAGSATLANPANAITSINGYLARSGLTVVDSTSLTLSGTVRAGLASDPVSATAANAAPLSITVNNGALAIGANATVGGSAVTLGATGALTEGTGAVLAASTLTGSAASASLTTINQVGTLNGFTATAGDFTLNNAPNLIVNGPVTAAAGALTITNGGTLSVLAGATPAAITGRSVALTATSMAISGNIGACIVGGLGGDATLTANAGAIAVGSTATIGGQASVTLNATGGVSLTGGLVNAPAVAVNTSLSIGAGQVFGNTVTVTGALALTGGTLHAGSLSAPSVAFGGAADLYAGNSFGATLTSDLTGQIASGGSLTLGAPGALTVSGTAVALGTLVVNPSGSLTQTGGTLAGNNLTLVSGGIVSQSGGLMAANNTLRVLGSGTTAASFSGALSAPTVLIAEPGVALTLTPTTLAGAPATLALTLGTYSFACPGCTSPAPTGALLVTPNVTAGTGRTTTLRADAQSLVLGSAGATLSATGMEFHSTGDTTANATILANTLTGTAGYRSSGSDSNGIPFYTTLNATTAGTGSATFATPTNAIDAITGYQARSGLTVVDATSLTLGGTVRAGLASDPVTGSAANAAPLSITVNNGALAIASAATVAGSAVTLNATAALTEAANAVLAANTLTGAAASIALPGNNQVATLNTLTATTGNLTLTDSRNLAIAGPVSADAGTVTITAQSGAGTPSVAEGQSAGTLSVLAGATPAAITGRSVALTATSMAVSGNIGACIVGGLGGDASLVATSGAIAVSAGATIGGQASVALAAPGGVTVAGGLVNGPIVNVNASLALSAGSVLGDNVAVTGTVSQTGGTLHATTLTTGGITFSGASDLYAGNTQSVTLSGPFTGQILSGGALTLTSGALTTSGTAVALGTLTLNASGDVTQTAGLLAGSSVLLSGALVNQSGGTLAATSTIQVTGSAATGAATFAGSLAAPTIRIVEPGATLAITPAALTGAPSALALAIGTPAYFCPGCTGPLTASFTAAPAVGPGAGRTASLRADGSTLTLGASGGTISATAVELHSRNDTTAPAQLVADTLTGTAGYAASGTLAGLPTYATLTAATAGTGGAATFATPTNTIAAIAGYQARTGLTVLDSTSLSLSGTVRAGLASDPVTGSAPNAAPLSITVSNGGLSIASAATVAGGAVALNAAGALTEAANAVLAANTLTGTAASIALPGNNQVATLNALTATAGDLTLTNSRNLAIAGPVAATAGTVGITVQNGAGTPSVAEGQSAGTLSVLAGAAPATITGRSVALTATSMAISGNIGACIVGGLGGDATLTANAGTIAVNAGATIGGQASIAISATGGTAVAGTVNAPSVIITGALSVGSPSGTGTVAGNTVAVSGPLVVSNGTLLAGSLTAPSVLFGGASTLYAGNDLAATLSTNLVGTILGGGNLALTAPAALTSSGTAVALGALTLTTGGDFIQTAGTIAGNSVSIAAAGVASQSATAPGTAPLLAANTTLRITGAGSSGAASFAGALSAPTVQIVEPGVPLSLTPAILNGAPTTLGLLLGAYAFNCPGCTGNPTATIAVTPTTPDVTAGTGRTAALRLDAQSITLGAPAGTISAANVELHSAADTTTPARLVADTLTGTAGYRPSSTAAGLPTYATLDATTAGTGAATFATPTNDIAAIAGYQARSGLTLVDAPSAGLTLTGIVRAGLASDPLAATAPNAAPLAITLTGPAGTLAIGTTAAPATLAGSTVALNASGAITESAASVLVANQLTGSAPAVSLPGRNQVATLGNFNAPVTGFSLLNARNLAIAGRLTAEGVPGTIAITVQDGAGTPSVAEGQSAGTLTILANAGASTITGREVTLQANGVTILGAIGAAGVPGIGGTVAVTSTGAIVTAAGSQVSGQNAVTMTAQRGITAGGIVDSPAVTLAGGLDVTATGQVFGNTVTVTGGATVDGGILHGTVLNAGTVAFNGGDLYAGNALAITVPASLTGRVASGGDLAVAGSAIASTAGLYAAGALAITATGDVRQVSGTFAGAAAVTVAAGGVLDQAAPGLITSGGQVRLTASGAGTAAILGTIAAPALQISEPGVALTATPTWTGPGTVAVGGLVNVFHCPGCDANTPSSTYTVTGLPGAASPTTLRIDGLSLTLGSLTATNVELHSVGSTSANGVVTAASLTGTAGYGVAGTGPDGLPLFTPSGANAGTGTATFAAGNVVTRIDGYVARSGLTFVDTIGLTLAGTVRAGLVTDPTGPAMPNAAPVSISTTGPLAIGDAAAPATLLAGSQITLRATGAITEQATSRIAATGLGGTAASVSLPGPNQIATITGFTAPGGFLLRNGATALNLTGPLDAGSSVIDITAGSLQQAAAGTVTAGLLTGTTAGSTDLTAAPNRITALGNYIVGAGSFSLVDTAGLTLVGALDAGAGTVRLDAPNISQNAAGIITAGTLRGAVAGTTDLGAATNAVQNLGPFSNTGGNFTLNDGAQRLTLTGALDAGTNVVTIAAGSLTQTASGAITAGTLAGLTTGTTDLRPAVNAIGAIGGFTVTNGDVRLNDGVQALALTGPVSLGAGTFEIRSGSLTQTGGILTAGLLTGSTTGATSLTFGDNAVAQLGAYTSGGRFALRNGPDLAVTGAVLAGGAAPNLTLTVGGAITIDQGSLTASSIVLQAGGAVREANAGRIDAGTLTVTAARLDAATASNSVGTLAATTAPGGITLVDSATLTVTGPLQTSGDLALATAGSLQLSGPLTAGGAATLTAAGPITLASNLAAGGPATFAAQGVTLAGNVTAASFAANAGAARFVQASGRVQANGAAAITAQGIALGGTLVSGVTTADAGAGALAITGSVFTASTAAFTAGGPLTLSGSLAAGGPASLQAQGIALSGDLTAASLAANAGNGAFTQSAGRIQAAGATSLTAQGIALGGSLATGALTAEAGAGALGITGTVASDGPATLTAGGPLTLSGSLAAGGLASLRAQGISVSGNLAAGALAANAGNGAFLQSAGRIQSAGPAAIAAQGITLAGTLAAGALTADAGAGPLAVGGSVNAGAAATFLSGASVSFAQGSSVSAGTTLTAAGTTPTNPTGAATFAGSLAAPLIIARAETITLNGGTISVGGVPQPPGVKSDALPRVDTSSAGAFFEAQSTFQQLGTTTVTPGFGASQATVRVDLVGSIGGTATFGTLFSAPQANLIVDVASGSIPTGNIDVRSLFVLYTGTGAAAGTVNLTGNVSGQGGTGAASVGQISPSATANFRINSCAIASVNCIVLRPAALPVGNPLKELTLSFFREQDDDSELVVPNITEQGL